jgi:hypothetical protein
LESEAFQRGPNNKTKERRNFLPNTGPLPASSTPRMYSSCFELIGDERGKAEDFEVCSDLRLFTLNYSWMKRFIDNIVH